MYEAMTIPFQAYEEVGMAVANPGGIESLTISSSEGSMRVLSEMRITAMKDEVLAALKNNRAQHKLIVEEARKGYVEKAYKALAAKIDKLKEGKIVSLGFSLHMPQDYTNVYDTAIKMMEMHQGTTIELTSEQVRSLIQDEWDWSRHFLMANSAYSMTAADIGSIRGDIAEDDD